MSSRLIIGGIAATLSLTGITSAFADATIATPGATSHCVGVTPGSTTVTASGQVSHSGSAFYFNGVSCLLAGR